MDGLILQKLIVLSGQSVFLSKEITKSTIIGNDLPTQQLKDKKNNIKPTTAISLQAKETIFSILKDFFDTEQARRV